MKNEGCVGKKWRVLLRKLRELLGNHGSDWGNRINYWGKKAKERL